MGKGNKSAQGGEAWYVWAFAAVMFAVQQYMIFYPPEWLGYYFFPLVGATMDLCQRGVDIAMGNEFDATADYSPWTLIPLSFIMVVSVYSMDRAIRMAVSGKVKDKNEVRTFSECFLRLFYYFMMFFVVIYVISLEDYWPEAEHCWDDFVSKEQPRPRELQATYLFELSYYIGGVVIHIFLNEHLKDFAVMLSHHLITITLLGLSFMGGYHRVGMLVLMCHDGCDIFLDGGKCFNAFKKEAYATVTVASLLVVWVYYRLYIFPVKVIYAGQNFALAAAEEQGMEDTTPMVLCFALLWCLLVLHIYWFVLIAKIVVRKLTKGKIEDIRVHKKKQ
eukprot:m.10449 g.10449  ORF g.10449 m.10449 type:complete len:333 (-) comp6603_c0_seq1:72-1070(-)